MSGLDLDAIEARLNAGQPHMESSAAAWGDWAATQQQIVETDVPALVARVRELEAVVQRVEALADSMEREAPIPGPGGWIAKSIRAAIEATA